MAEDLTGVQHMVEAMRAYTHEFMNKLHVIHGLRQLKNTEAVSDYGMMAAGAMVTSLPTLLLIFFGQKRLQEGMTKGAIK